MLTSAKSGLSAGFRKLIFGVVGLLLVVGLGLLVWPRYAPPKVTANTLESFAMCLKEKGLTMYGSDTCPNCLNQKKMFGSAFEKINYVNCDFHQDECKRYGITAYPVWIRSGEAMIGLQSLPDLAFFGECKLPPLSDKV